MKQKETNPNAHIFQRLQTELAHLIAETPPGEQLPAEPELSRQLGVSRATLREAMRSFEGQGLIRRRQGKGTFVIGHPQVIDSGLEVLESIETLAHRIELDVTMGSLKIYNIQASQEQAEALGVEPGSSLIQVDRVILAGSRAVAYLVDVLPEGILSAEELQAGFTGSVLDLLMRHSDLTLTTSRAEVQAAVATPDIARALEIQRGDVLLSFVARLFTNSGNVVDYSQSYFIPGYFRFHVVRRVGSSNLF